LADIVQEIGMCATQYKNNLCESNPVPAMMQQCASWKTCMERDPTTIGRARVGAELIAEVVNGFVEPISWKTLVSTCESFQASTDVTYLSAGFYIDIVILFDAICQFLILFIPHTSWSCPFFAAVCSSPCGTIPPSLHAIRANTLAFWEW